MTTPSRSYQHTTTSALATETAAEQARRNGISPALATSRDARAGEPIARPVPQLKGAVKVSGFPTRSIYPFREIAEDGGVWKLDPAAFTWRGKPTKPNSVYTAARKYATDHGLTVKTVVDDGMVYVQFSHDQGGVAAARRAVLAEAVRAPGRRS